MDGETAAERRSSAYQRRFMILPWIRRTSSRVLFEPFQRGVWGICPFGGNFMVDDVF